MISHTISWQTFNQAIGLHLLVAIILMISIGDKQAPKMGKIIESIEADLIDISILTIQRQAFLEKKTEEENQLLEQELNNKQKRLVELKGQESIISDAEIKQNKAINKASKDKVVREHKLSEEKAKEDYEKQLLLKEEEQISKLQQHEHSKKLSRLKVEYKSAIKRHIETNWVIPQSSRWEGSCTAFVRQNPAGEVTSVNIESCDSDFAYKKSLENAIWKSSPFPLAPNKELFEREVKISFNPEEN
jgi:hypothetical protein